jgi:AcrR family transcriptional regulator
MPTQTKPKRVSKRPEDRREDLLAAAEAVFADKGLAEATVADITTAAGVAKGTFYLYFDSKDHLVGALKEQFVDRLVQITAQALERIGVDDWWELVDALVETIIDFELEHRDVHQVLMHESLAPEPSDLFVECDRKMRGMIVDGIQAGIDAGAFRASDPEITAALLDHAIEGTMHHALRYGHVLDRDRFVAAAKELVHKTLAP